MSGFPKVFTYHCGGCDITARAETWDPHELPKLYCGKCGEQRGEI